MNYLTNFYKNKVEQIQEKINKLETKLSLHEKYRGFDIDPDFQNILYPPAWYVNRGLPNPWDAMDPKTRSKELRRHMEFWSTRAGTNPVGQGSFTPNLPNMPLFQPSAAGRSALQSASSSFMGEQTLHEGDSMQVAGMADAPATYVPPFQVAGVAGSGMNMPNIPAAPQGAPPSWLSRWNYIFTNWNNWQPNTNIGGQYFSSPGAALGWLMGQWGNPIFGTWS